LGRFAALSKPKHDVNESQPETHAKLCNLFNELGEIPCDVVTTNNNPMAVRHDAFIRSPYSLALEAQLKTFSTSAKTDFSMEWLPGGHVAGAMMRPIYHNRIVIDTVQSLIRS
jgi:hypothetical protein